MGVGFNLIWSVFPFLFIFMFVLIAALIIMSLVRGVSQWRKNNASPVLTVEAKVVTKRADRSDNFRTDTDGMSHRSSNTFYYATFQVESGDRMELPVSSSEYGLLAEGDQGRLTFQGTRYHSFSRQP